MDARAQGDEEYEAFGTGSGRIAEETQELVKFKVEVVGGPPWHVVVSGRAATWRGQDARPSVYREGDAPGWYEMRENALVMALHRELERCCHLPQGK